MSVVAGSYQHQSNTDDDSSYCLQKRGNHGVMVKVGILLDTKCGILYSEKKSLHFMKAADKIKVKVGNPDEQEEHHQHLLFDTSVKA